MRITGTLQSRRSSVTRLIGSVLGSLLVVLAFTGAAAAPADNGGRPTVARAAPPVLEVVAMDYAFRLPDTVRAGVTTVRLINRGQHMHHIQLVRLDGGHTIADLLRAWKPGVPTPRWMTGVGGPTAPVGGQTLDALVVLRPGRYGVLCWVPAADGQLHFQKGMFGQFEVAAPSGGAAEAPLATALPPADVTITMVDYGYVMPGIARGRHTVRVFNGGPQSHELVLVRLASGRTARDAAAWAERGQTGDAPGTMVGGVAALAPGGVAQFAADFPAGQYALICFVPDQKDGTGRPHTEHGMLRQFAVR
jgi:uncharacterized cupredoxin-like copper-binding protein